MIDLSGNDCYVIGAGTSLKGFDFSKLDNKFTIGINHVIEHYDNINCHIFGDTTFIKTTTYDMTKFKGHIFASKKSMHHPPIYQMKDNDNVTIYEDNRKEITFDIKKGLYHPTSSGILALNLALLFNPNKIYLLGLDYYKDKGEMHFFDDYEHHVRYKESKLKDKVKMFLPFKDFKDKIINLNPDSELKIFKRMSWNEHLLCNTCPQGF